MLRTRHQVSGCLLVAFLWDHLLAWTADFLQDQKLSRAAFPVCPSSCGRASNIAVALLLPSRSFVRLPRSLLVLQHLVRTVQQYLLTHFLRVGIHVGRAHLLDDIIANLQLSSDYYRTRTLPMVLPSTHPLAVALRQEQVQQTEGASSQ